METGKNKDILTRINQIEKVGLEEELKNKTTHTHTHTHTHTITLKLTL